MPSVVTYSCIAADERWWAMVSGDVLAYLCLKCRTCRRTPKNRSQPLTCAYTLVATVKLLFIGDIVGEPGRRAVRDLLPRVVAREGISFVIANGENSAGGRGITPLIARELFGYGIDVLTLGDHAWDQKELLPYFKEEPRLLRPGNYPSGAPGRGHGVFQRPGQPKVAVINLQARTFMPPMENPFLMAQTEVARCRVDTPILFVDFHGEATSEKIAMGRMLDGSVTAMVGTHTHVQTADETLLPGGTAYLTDAGFTGPHDSVIGRDVQPVLERFLTGLPTRFSVARGDIRMQGAIVELDASTGRALAIHRVNERMSED